MLSAWQPPRFPVMSQLLVTGPAGPRGSPGERQVSCAPRWGRFVCSRLPQSWVARATGFPEAVSMMQASQGRAPGGGSGNWLLSPPPWAPGSSSLPSCGHRRPPADRGTWQALARPQTCNFTEIKGASGDPTRKQGPDAHGQHTHFLMPFPWCPVEPRAPAGCARICVTPLPLRLPHVTFPVPPLSSTPPALGQGV